MSRSVRVLGLDPGTARVGFAVLDADGRQQQLVTFGTLTTAADLGTGERLARIARGIRRLVTRYHPELVAIEQLFFQTNVKTALAVSEARGVLLLTCAEARLPVIEFTPNEIKRTVTGDGRATKPAIAKMIQLLLKLRRLPTDDDAADAVAIAVTATLHHPHHHGT